MGGFGSGYPSWKGRKVTVESCLPLDLAALRRDRSVYPIPPGQGLTGTLEWHSVSSGEKRGRVAYTLGYAEGGLRLWLRYQMDGEDVELPIQIEDRADGWWWFRCPLVVGGVPCRGRCRKLYLPPGARYFGCRRCWRLTYTSCRESHQSSLVELYKRLLAADKPMKRQLARMERLNQQRARKAAMGPSGPGQARQPKKGAEVAPD